MPLDMRYWRNQTTAGLRHMITDSNEFRSPATDNVITLENRKSAFAATLTLWPEEIDTSDKEFLPGNGFTVENLWAAYDQAEQQARTLFAGEGEQRVIEILTMNWLIYCRLSADARTQDKVAPAKVTFDEVDDIYRNGHPITGPTK